MTKSEKKIVLTYPFFFFFEHVTQNIYFFDLTRIED